MLQSRKKLISISLRQFLWSQRGALGICITLSKCGSLGGVGGLGIVSTFGPR